MGKIIDFNSGIKKEYDENYKFASEFNICSNEDIMQLRYFVSSALICSGLTPDKNDVLQYQVDNKINPFTGSIDLKTARDMQYKYSSKKMIKSIAPILDNVEIERNKQLKRGKIFFSIVLIIVAILIVIGSNRLFNIIRGFIMYIL